MLTMWPRQRRSNSSKLMKEKVNRPSDRTPQLRNAEDQTREAAVKVESEVRNDVVTLSNTIKANHEQSQKDIQQRCVRPLVRPALPDRRGRRRRLESTDGSGSERRRSTLTMPACAHRRGRVCDVH